uniref:Tr-type G domain-containing protein n=1 Tax=Aegilops tauschii subsp. strangulata TaxID=200361 RepID=A0A452XLR6_AEGTS
MNNESFKSYKGERDGDQYLVNLIDSPGHTDFSSEVTTALRVTDGALLVIDAIEGVCMQTEAVLCQALNEMVRPVLCVNKMDKLFPDLQVESANPESVGHKLFSGLQDEGAKPESMGERAYKTLSNVIENSNEIMKAHGAERLGDVQVYPETSSVAFASGLHGWAFTIASFAKKYALKCGVDETKFAKRLWGDNFYNSATKKWTRKNSGSDNCIRGFVQFCYNPINTVLMACMNDNKGELWDLCQKLEVSLRDDEKDLTGMALVKCVMQTWLPASTALLEMMICHLPSPLEAQRYRVESLYEGPLDDKYAEAIKKCDPEGPLMLYVSKMVPASDVGRFFAFGRVFSGRIAAGMKVRVMGPSYVPGMETDLYVESVQRTIIWMGKKQCDVPDVPCGNTVGLIGLDACITKSATLTSEKEVVARPIRAMKLSVCPLMFVTVNCKVPTDVSKLVQGLKRLAMSDPVVLCSQVEPGTYTVAGVGELHLEICLKDLQENFMDGVEVAVSSPPVVSFRETVRKSCDPVEKKFRNNQIRYSLSVVARPLDEKVVEAIEDGRLGPRTDHAVRSEILAKHGWDKDLGDKIWCFGPDAVGPNVIVNRCKVIQNLELAKKVIVAGFEVVAKEGALAKERMHGICFEVHNVNIHADEALRGTTAQLNEMVRTALIESQLAAKPRLLEPTYTVAIQCPKSALSTIYGILHQRNGSVYEEFVREGTMLHILKAYVPVYDSFGLSKAISAATSKLVTPQCIFGYWSDMCSDPFQANAPAGQMVLDIRERKKMGRPSFQKSSGHNFLCCSHCSYVLWCIAAHALSSLLPCSAGVHFT